MYDITGERIYYLGFKNKNAAERINKSEDENPVAVDSNKSNIII